MIVSYYKDGSRSRAADWEQSDVYFNDKIMQ